LQQRVVRIHQLAQRFALPLFNGATGSYCDLAYPLEKGIVPHSLRLVALAQITHHPLG
jgi:hypothetical protein